MSETPTAQNQTDASTCPTGPGLPLMLISEGQEVQLLSVQGGKRLRHRLAEIGLVPGTKFRVITPGKPGPFIVSVKNHRLVLGQEMVQRLLVCPA